MTTTIQINERGSLTLPKDLRCKLGLKNGGVVIVDMTEQGINLRPAVAYPVEMYTDERVAEFDIAEKDLKQHQARKSRR